LFVIHHKIKMIKLIMFIFKLLHIKFVFNEHFLHFNFLFSHLDGVIILIFGFVLSSLSHPSFKSLFDSIMPHYYKILAKNIYQYK